MTIFVFIERVVKLETSIAHKLGDTVDFELWLMHHDLWVTSADRVNFSLLVLLVEKRTFPHADADIHVSGTNVVERSSNLLFLFFNEKVELDVSVVASEFLVSFLSLGLELLLFFLFLSTRLSLCLDFLDSFHGCWF